MTVATRRPTKAGYGVTVQGANNVKNFNKNLRYVQGFRQTIAAGATVNITINLLAPGKELLGIAMIPLSTSDFSDVQLFFTVNNNNLLSGAGAQNTNPNFVQGMVFYPTPQPLSGNDTIVLQVKNNSAAPVQAIFNIYYVPRV